MITENYHIVTVECDGCGLTVQYRATCEEGCKAQYVSDGWIETNGKHICQQCITKVLSKP